MGTMADGVLAPVIAILPSLLRVPTTRQLCSFSPSEHRLGLRAKSSNRCASQLPFSPGSAYPIIPCSDRLITPVRAASPAQSHSSRPQRQCIEYTFILRASLSGQRRFTRRGSRCSSRLVSLHGAVPYSSPRKGVQSAWIAGSQNAPPPLMPEKATSASGRPAAIGRPRIPSCRSYRAPPKVWLSLRALSPRAPSLMTDSLLRALVARNR